MPQGFWDVQVRTANPRDHNFIKFIFNVLLLDGI